MLKALSSLGRHRSILAVAALSSAALSACAPSPAGAEPLALGPSRTVLDDRSPFAAPCVAGTWISQPQACSCELRTEECAASDCLQADVLMLLACDEAVRVTVRYSAALAQLSAVSEPQGGTWTYHDDGELALFFDGNATYTPAECVPDEGGLQLKGQPYLTHPPPALADSLAWAWWFDEWTAAPYEP